MHKSSVLRGVRLAEGRRQVRAEDLVWPGLDPAALREEPPIYTERQVEELMAGVRAEAHEEGRQTGCEEGRYLGYEDGLREGVDIGRQDERVQLQAAGAELAAIAGAVMDARARILAGAARDLVHLALTMAERIVRRSLSMDDEIVLRAVREALGRIGEAHRVVVRLNPSEMEKIERHREELTALLAGDARIELRSDPAVTPGGCLIDTAELHLDGSVEGMLDRLDEILQAFSERAVSAARCAPDENGPAEEAGEAAADPPSDSDADGEAGGHRDAA